MVWSFNPFTGKLDNVDTTDISGLVPYTGATNTLDLGSEDLITTGTATIADIDITSAGLLENTPSGSVDIKSLINKEYVDLAVTSLGATYYMYDENDATGYKTCYLNPSSDSETYIEVADLDDDDSIGDWISATGEAPTKLLKGIYNWYATLEKTGTKTLRVYWKLIERKSDTSEVVIATSSNSNEIEGKANYLVPLQLDNDYIPDSGSRIVGKLYADVSGGGSAPTVRLYYQGNTSSRWEIPANSEIFQNIFVPYTGAVSNLDLGDKDLTTTGTGTFNTLAVGTAYTFPSADGTANQVIKTDGSGNLSWTTPAGGGDVSGPDSATDGNVVFFDGVTGKLIKDSGLTLSGTNTGDQDLSGLALKSTTISTTAPLSGGGDLSANRTLTISQAGASTNGYLSSTDWNTFNGKQDALPVADTQTIVKGSADATKLIRFEVDGLTASTTRVLTVQDKDITIADNADLTAHTGNTSNPHSVTAAQVGINDTDDISEGSTNLYFNGKTTDDLPEGSTNKYDIDHFSGKTQDDLPDGTTYKQYNPANVAITGGSIAGITDLAVADGGTGASDAAGARTNLGLEIGSDVQAYDATLQSISGLGTAADKIAYTTGIDTWAETTISAFGRSLIDDADAATARTTLGAGTMSDLVDDTSPQLGGNLDMNSHNIEGVTPTEMGYLSGVTSAIQTQLNGKMSDLVDDTSPQLGGDLDAQANHIGFTQQTISYNSGTTTVDWGAGNKATLTFGAGNITTLAFTNPPKPSNLLLKIVQDGTGSRTITNWDSDIKWAGGSPPTLSTDANAIDIVSFYFDGNSYYGVASLDFS